ncbi:hypothetical protein D082_09200 [Synechocystis sp. PCC 6714]|nr:hypothetical protein D082_09200 [Synechocystis sp. PCC 6714]
MKLKAHWQSSKFVFLIYPPNLKNTGGTLFDFPLGAWKAK